MAEPKKVMIYSDGYGGDARVMTEDGTVLEGLRSAVISIEAKEFNKVDLEIFPASTNVRAHVRSCSMVCPLCSEVIEHSCD